VISDAPEPLDGVQVPAALATPNGKDVIATEVHNFRASTGRVDVVAGVLELSAKFRLHAAGAPRW